MFMFDLAKALVLAGVTANSIACIQQHLYAYQCLKRCQTAESILSDSAALFL
jgi:hypothetical protein